MHACSPAHGLYNSNWISGYFLQESLIYPTITHPVQTCQGRLLFIDLASRTFCIHFMPAPGFFWDIPYTVLFTLCSLGGIENTLLPCLYLSEASWPNLCIQVWSANARWEYEWSVFLMEHSPMVCVFTSQLK